MPEQDSQAIVERLLPEANRRLIRSADSLADDDYATPSALPGWTRGHVLAHLALNAEGLAGALGGLVEGERAPMYASQDARDGDIDALAADGPSAIRTRLLRATTELADAIGALPDDQWDATFERTPGGRTMVAGAVPRMRLQEVEIHHADLAAGYSHADWTPEFTTVLLDAMGPRDEGTDAFRAHANDLDRTWSFGDGGPTVSGTGADLGWWLAGRGTGEGLSSDSGTLPRIGTW